MAIRAMNDRQTLSARGCKNAAEVRGPFVVKQLGYVQTGYLAGGPTVTGKLTNRSGGRPNHATGQEQIVRRVHETQTSRLTPEPLRRLPRFACQTDVFLRNPTTGSPAGSKASYQHIYALKVKTQNASIQLPTLPLTLTLSTLQPTSSLNPHQAHTWIGNYSGPNLSKRLASFAHHLYPKRHLWAS